MFSASRELSVSEVARHLGISAGHVTQMMRDGVLGARQLPSGDWLTTQAALEIYALTTRRGHGRTLNPASAWGVLWELSGMRPDWLSPSTLSRLRTQMHKWGSEDIVRAVSSRTRQTRFATASRTASVGLTLTARPVASSLKVGLKSWPDVVAGYVQDGSVAEHAREHSMIPDYEGKHSLYEWTLPIPYSAPQMPEAVIAADCARSFDTAERKKGLFALQLLKAKWTERLRR